MALTAVLAVVTAACDDGSDSAGGDPSGVLGSGGLIGLSASETQKPGFDAEIPAFNATEEGRNLAFRPSYGPSGDLSREVKGGGAADLVSFSTEPDITRLVDAGLVDKSWNMDAYKGIPSGSVVTIVVRKGNPKNIHDWDDLLRPDVEVVTADPSGSGPARWNLLAPYAAKSNGGQDPAAGLAYLRALVGGHVRIRPESSRTAAERFLQGTGDVLLGSESEAHYAEGQGDPVEHVIPSATFRIENPVAVLSNSKNLAKADAFKDFLYTTEGQKLWAEAGFRPVDPGVAKEFADKFPSPATLWTIADLGGWTRIDPELFAKDSGSISIIYDDATR